MARVSTYLNFPRSTEAAFLFYKSVFKSEFVGDIARFGDAPPCPGQPPLTDADKNLVMHIALPILAGHMLMGTDAPESMGFTVTMGNNNYISLEPDTRTETEALFAALAVGGQVEMSLQDMFWAVILAALPINSACAGCLIVTPKPTRQPSKNAIVYTQC